MLIIPDTQQPVRCVYEYRWTNRLLAAGRGGRRPYRSYRCTNFHAPGRLTCARGDHPPMQCAPLADGWPDETDARYERWPTWERGGRR